MKEQLREMEQGIHELEREIEVKERELHAIRLDTQAVCYHLCSYEVLGPPLFKFISQYSIFDLGRCGPKMIFSENKTKNWQILGMGIFFRWLY